MIFPSNLSRCVPLPLFLPRKMIGPVGSSLPVSSLGLPGNSPRHQSSGSLRALPPTLLTSSGQGLTGGFMWVSGGPSCSTGDFSVWDRPWPLPGPFCRIFSRRYDLK